MFSDLARDDVFRLETQRLWLRWPKASDAPAVTRYAGNAEVAHWTSAIPHPYPPGGAEQFILRARANNAAGTALHLVVTPLRNPREVIGGIGLDLRMGKLTLGYVFAPDVWGKGFATEAACALVDGAFSLTEAEALHSGAFLDNARSRRVLEKAGFAPDGVSEEYSEARGAAQKLARVRIDRQDWLARRAAFAASVMNARDARAAIAR